VNASHVSTFAKHRNEVAEVAEAIAGSSVQFAVRTHADIWDEWESSSRWPGLEDHLAALRARYQVKIQ
jgi:hypothetical protein